MYGGGNGDATLTRFSSSGILRWSTYIGGSNTEWPNGLATDNSRNLVLSGYTQSSNFPVTSDAYQVSLNGLTDAVVMKFDSSGQRQWGTYIGGNDYDWGNGVATDRNSIYICGTTYSTNFPVTANAFQATRGASYDLFVTKFCDLLPTVSISGSTQICPGESVVLTASADFDSYLWSTGAVTRSITVSQPGQYFVTATIGACSGSSDTIRVTVHPTVKPKVSPNNSVFCDGDSVVITIPGTYVSQRWSNGATTARIVARQTGIYYVDAVDGNGCIIRSDTANVTVTPRPNPLVVPSGVITLCNGDTIELDAGSGYRDYLWSTFETTRKIRVSKAGVYSVMVTSQQFCSATSQPVILRLNSRPDSTVTPLRPLDFCEGDSTIVVGRPGYRYLWSTGATSQLVTLRKSGLYSLTVTDSIGCSSTAQFRVHVTPAMWQSIYVEGDKKVICEGDSVILDAGANQKGYRWSTGDTTQHIVVRAPGNYSVRFESPIGCPGYSDTVRITVYPRPIANISGPVGVCSNSVATYAVEQRPELKYTWKISGADGTILSGDGTSQAMVRWGSSGTGKVHVMLSNIGTGCTAENEITVDVGSGIKPVILANRPARICPNDSITLDAGPGYAIYRWSTGEMTRHITVTEAQPYTVIVTNNDGCTGASDPFIVIHNPDLAPAITPLGPTDFCRGDSVVLDAGDYAGYLWSNGAQTRRIAVRDPGSYAVTVTDSVGCSGTAQPVSVTRYTPPSPAIDGPNSVCANATAQYTTSNVTGDSYQWSISGGGRITDGQGTSSITVKWSGVGPESIDLVQTSNGIPCEGIAERYNVTVSNTIVPNVAVKGSPTFCEGDSVKLSAPGGYDSYKWSTGDTTRQITVNSAGIYTVRVISSEGCEGTSAPVMITVVEQPTPTIAVNGPLSFCEGDSVLLIAPAGYLDYRWSNGQTTPTITVKSTGTYMVSVTNATGCNGSSFAVAVDVHPLPTMPVIVRNGDTLHATTIPAEYQWMLDGAPLPGATEPNLVAREPGTYRVRITNDNGCSVESAPYQVSSSKPIYIVALDTVSAVAGERLVLTMSVDTALTVADAITSYRFLIQYDPLALFPLHVSKPSAVTGGSPTMRVTQDGIYIEQLDSSALITGREIFKLEMLGLITGQPVNLVTIEGAFNGITVDSTRYGLVLLSGCDIGHELKLVKAIAIRGVRPNPVGDEAIIVYRAPEGSTPQLVVSDMAGRDVLSMELPPGTGEEQEQRLNANRFASGVYRFELRDRNERSVVPVIIVR
jgi:hypothetical protein